MYPDRNRWEVPWLNLYRFVAEDKERALGEPSPPLSDQRCPLPVIQSCCGRTEGYGIRYSTRPFAANRAVVVAGDISWYECGLGTAWIEVDINLL